MMESIYEQLDEKTKEWAIQLSPTEIANILKAFHKIKPAISKSSVSLGKFGEEKFEEICKGLPINYRVESTAKQAGKGDFIIKFTNDGKTLSCLIDIKNYSSTVPRKEIDKFHEDLASGNYDAGVLLSLNSKFVDKHAHISQEDIASHVGKIPVLYLSELSSEMILNCIEYIFLKASHYQFNENADLDRIDTLIECINSELSSSAHVRRTLSDLVTHVTNSIHRCQETLCMHEVHLKKALREMNNCTSRAIIKKIIPHVPKIDNRVDNIAPDEKISLPNDVLTYHKIRMETEEFENYKLLLESIEWTTRKFDSKPDIYAELTCDYMTIKIIHQKNKNYIIINFTDNSEVEEETLNRMGAHINKSGKLVSRLNNETIDFLQEYINTCSPD